jgi:VWFA-related protein
MSLRLHVPAVALLLSANSLFAQFNERIDVSAIEVPVVVRDAKGNVPTDLKPSDFVLLEDGKPQEIIGLAYPVKLLPRPAGATALSEPAAETPADKHWVVVIYIDQLFSSTHGLSKGLLALADHTTEMAALGEVQVVGDEGTPRFLASSTRDPAVLRTTLLDLSKSIRGQEQLIRLRTQYIQEKTNGGALTKTGGGFGQAERTTTNLGATQSLTTARLEALMVRSRQEALVTFADRAGDPSRPHALVYVGGGYDMDPADFYGGNGSTEATMRTLSAAERQTQIGESIAAAGWTVVSFAPMWMESASSPAFDVNNSGRDSTGKHPETVQGAINIDPLRALRTLADETGGSVLTDPSKLSLGLDDLASRIVLTYQLRRPRDGKAHHITVKSLRPGLTLRVQRSVVAGTAEVLAVSRATGLIGDQEGERGELPVRCTMKDLPSKDGKEVTAALVVYVDFAPIDAVRASLEAAALRFSIAVRGNNAPPFSLSKRMENVNLAKQPKWAVDFEIKHNPGAKVGVVAEELATGVWGGAPCN